MINLNFQLVFYYENNITCEVVQILGKFNLKDTSNVLYYTHMMSLCDLHIVIYPVFIEINQILFF